MVELQENLKKIHQEGYGFATISYDPAAVIKAVEEHKHFTFPMIADPGDKIIKAWGVLNVSITNKKSFLYGVAYPGVFVIGPDSRVKTKYFEANYNDRMPVYEVLRQMGAAPARPQAVKEAKHLRLATSASSTWIHPNERVTLSLDIALPQDVHVYAPGVKGYRAIEFQMDSSTAAKFLPVKYPVSQKLHLAVIHETVPAYVDTFRITDDMITGYESQIKPLLDAKGELTLRGTLHYQACDDRECYMPASVPLKWIFSYRPLDRLRSARPEVSRKDSQ